MKIWEVVFLEHHDCPLKVFQNENGFQFLLHHGDVANSPETRHVSFSVLFLFASHGRLAFVPGSPARFRPINDTLRLSFGSTNMETTIIYRQGLVNLFSTDLIPGTAAGLCVSHGRLGPLIGTRWCLSRPGASACDS